MRVANIGVARRTSGSLSAGTARPRMDHVAVPVCASCSRGVATTFVVAVLPASGAHSAFRVATPHFTAFVSGRTPGFSAGKAPSGIVALPGGDVWFTELTGIGGTPGIAKITAAGRVTEYPTGTYDTSRPLAIAVGADGNLWFADSAAAAIGRMTPAGRLTFFRRGLSKGDAPAGIASGRGGTLWFVSSGTAPYVGTVDARGTIAEVARLGASFTADPSLAEDEHGNVWLTGNDGAKEQLVRVERSGRVSMRPIPLSPGLNPCCVYPSPQAFATRRDGTVWFANLFYASARSGNHPLGAIDERAVHLSFGPLAYIGSVARGLGNDLWFADQDPFLAAAAIGTVGPQGGLRIFQLPRGLSPLSITVARTGALWMTATTGTSNGAVIRATP